MKHAAKTLPVTLDAGTAQIRSGTWGAMTCAHMTMQDGVDFTPLLSGLEDDHCPCPHWGYVIQGRIRVSYTDGTEEIVSTGDLYYWPPGHTVVFEEDTEYVEFSPADEMGHVLDHVQKRMQSA